MRVVSVNVGLPREVVWRGRATTVYAYPAEHYPAWARELERELPWGSFGENLTLEGLPLEDGLALGDRLRAGTAELVVTQPRLPCFKLGIRFGDPSMVARFLASGRTGYYLRVAVEGEVRAGDAVEVLRRHPAGVPVSELTRLYAGGRKDGDRVRRVLDVDALPGDWRRFLGRPVGEAGAAGPGRVPRG